jgi:elongation factor Ts
MAEITASMVKELREVSGAGMMDCKKALAACDGDMQKSIDFLREKGLAQAAKKSDRIAAEGLTAMAITADGRKGSVVEVNSETDFVAKNEEFKEFVDNAAKIVCNSNIKDIEELKAAKYLDQAETVQDVLTAKIAKIGENMNLRRFETIEVSSGAVLGYVHGAGKISVIVGLESEASFADLEELGKDLAMQVAAMNPKYITKDDVDPEYIAHEREVLMAQALNEGKPQNIVEKMVEGRLQKELKEVCLVEQVFIKDSDLSIKKLIENISKKLGKSIKVAAVKRFEVGDGIEKKSENFAEEVAKQMNN